MARLPPLWQQNNAYRAQEDRRLIGTLWPVGGVDGMAPTVVTGTMRVAAALGTAVVPDSRVAGAGYLCASDAPEEVTLDQAPPSGQDRIDLVVVNVRDSQFGGVANEWILDKVTGVPAANPVVPAVPLGTAVIAQQRVVGGTAFLTAANLLDRRLPLAPGPIGNMATANGPASQQDYGAAGGIPVSLTFVARAGRKYRAHGYALGQQQTNQTTLAQLTFRAGAVNRFMFYTNFIALLPGTWCSGAAWIDIVPGATGPVVVDVNVTAQAGAMRVRANEANITVDDIGRA